MIGFLVSEGEPTKIFFEMLVKVYGDASIAYSTVKKWVSKIKDEEDDPSLSSLHDRRRSVRQRSAGKIMATVFRDIEGVILVNFMPKGTTINADVYIDNLRKLKARLRRVRPYLDMSKVLLQHDNARSHTSLKTREVIASFGWTTVTHPPYSPDLAPSDYHLFGPLKEGVRGKHFISNQEVKNAVRNWLKIQPVDFYKAGIVSFVHRWTFGIEKREDYIKK